MVDHITQDVIWNGFNLRYLWQEPRMIQIQWTMFPFSNTCEMVTLAGIEDVIEGLESDIFDVVDILEDEDDLDIISQFDMLSIVFSV